jgi:hypothetical protein
VRLYRRGDHYILQWWDPGEKKNVADRVDGDLLAALVQARRIDERLLEHRSAGIVRRSLSHRDLVERYLADLEKRAEAGEVDSSTVRRYTAALKHYQVFCDRPQTARAFANPVSVNRDFRLAFAAFLAAQAVTPNGRHGAAARPMRSPGFVLDAVRALFEWASDPERGGLLPEDFRNPFRHCGASRSVLQGDPLAEPDITVPMAIDLVSACDPFQLRLFAPILLFGLRAAEPCFLFWEYCDTDWLRVPNNTDLDYRTKGRRDKRFPLIADLATFWSWWRRGCARGPVYERRSVVEGNERAPLRSASVAEIVAEFRSRCGSAGEPDAVTRAKLRDQVLRDAGGLNYDQVESEFSALAKRLGWPRQATLKDLRHLFATTINNAAMPEPYRRFLMGQSPGKAAIVAYTHLNELRRHYTEAVQREWPLIVAAILKQVTRFQPPADHGTGAT